MVLITSPPPSLDPNIISVYYVIDELLARSPILVFYGLSSTPSAATSANNSRIQAHIFSPAGLQSYPRLTIAPSSPLYTAVNCLPREEQGDDISRGLAFSLYKYFAELPQHVRGEWENNPQTIGKLRNAPALFSDAHAASLASRMIKIENTADIIRDVRQGLAEQTISWLDLDVLLRPGAVNVIDNSTRDSAASDINEEDLDKIRYGDVAELVQLFGESSFMPTSKLRRAPSRPTALNRSSKFTKSQKENLRREMCELLDTEENYVSKIDELLNSVAQDFSDELLNSVAQDFNDKARARTLTSASPSEEALMGLFPDSLDQILEVNSGFLEALRRVLHETENDAIQDIESTPDEVTPYAPDGPTATDVTGTLALATCLRTWFPKFADCYAHYMKAHIRFPHYLRMFLRDSGSSFSKRMIETGEQKIMSMLIEPVQRLPRYNLYIDNLIKQLPIRHPALKVLLKSRDIISEICSQDSTSIEPTRMIERLRRLIPSWPSQFTPKGRFITAIDVTELPPPYRIETVGNRAICGIILLFTDHMVILKKLSQVSITARGLAAQMDGSDIASSRTDDLTFRQAFELNSFDMTEVDNYKMIQIIPHQPANSRPGSRLGSYSAGNAVQMFYLNSAYEGKANKVVEELTKARIEGRFPEAEREGRKFEVRSSTVADLTFFAGLSEMQDECLRDDGSRSIARIFIEPHPDAFPGEFIAGNDILASVHLTHVRDTPYRLEFYGPNDYHFVEELTGIEFLPVLAKRFRDVLLIKNQIKYPPLTRALLAKNLHILQSLRIVASDVIDGPKETRSRPHSPVKMLTNLFSGTTSTAKDSVVRRLHVSTLSLTDIPQLARPGSAVRTPDENSFLTEPGRPISAHSNSTPLERLEDTLSSFLLAIHARKGNIVGKTLRMRHVANELQVNELCNGLLENPSDFELAAQMSVDVLFRAFEKFIKLSWQEKMSPIVSQQMWLDVQARLESLQASDFDDAFRKHFCDMSPQNQRAFKTIIKLLRELLEGASNDGDRGIMTACFAEILVPEGRPMEFVSVLDRLVEDFNHLMVDGYRSGTATPMGSITSQTRYRATNTGSLTPNTSSLRRKFGLLSRKGSKNQPENEAESVSVWRTLSKSKHGTDSQPSSLSKASHIKTNSSTSTGNSIAPKRPVSRERPTVLGAFAFEATRPLSTIGESEMTGPPRKKRRSSLPDIAALRSTENTPTHMLRTPNKGEPAHLNLESPRTPSPTKQSHIPMISPARVSSAKKENSPTRMTSVRASPSRTLPRAFSPSKVLPSTPSTLEDSPTQQNTSRRHTRGSSGIPTLKPGVGLSERPTSGNVRRLPATPSSEKTVNAEKPAPLNPANGKLRMQSPQKLRARLQEEHKAINDADASMQEHLRKIGEELQQSSSLRSRPLHVRAQSTNTPAGPTADIKALQAKLAAIGKQYGTALTALKSQLEAVKSDAVSSLEVSEKRAGELDKLYQEAEAENVALYAQVNESLRSMAQHIKDGNGLAEMKKRAEHAEDEATKLRKENWRLKREVTGLRAQLRE